MTSDAELDAKLARIGQRVHQQNTERAAQVREELAAIGCLDLAEAARHTFGARLAYLKTPRVELGNPIVNGDNLMRPGCVWTPYTPPKKRRGE